LLHLVGSSVLLYLITRAISRCMQTHEYWRMLLCYFLIIWLFISWIPKCYLEDNLTI